MLLLFLTFFYFAYATDLYAPGWLPPAQKFSRLTVTSNGLHYLLNVTLGTPPQVVRLVFDTGSANVVAFGPDACDGVACYSRDQSTTFELDSVVGTFELLVDGEYISSQITENGYEMMTLPMEWIGTPAKENVSDSIRCLLGKDLDVFGGAAPQPLHREGWGSGVIGATYQPFNSKYDSPLHLLLSQATKGELLAPIFSLDFNDASEPSYLYIGGIAEAYRPHLSWSFPHHNTYHGESVPPIYHSFTLFDLSLCGVNLITDSNNEDTVLNRGGLEGIIDTGAACLALPAEFFDMVVSWLPVACGYDGLKPFTYDDCVSKTGNSMFYLRPNASDSLPDLKFRFNPEGEWLYMSLSTLLLDPQPGDNYWPTTERRPFCVVRTAPTSSGGEISFGTRALRSFFATLNMETYQVGLANKITLKESNVQCAERVVCYGMQTHDPASNICKDPPCHLYYFFTFNSETKKCELALSFHVIAIFIIFMFFLIELGLNELHQWLSTKVIKNIEDAATAS